MAAIPMSGFEHPHLGDRVDLGVENGTDRNLVPTFIFDFYIHYTVLHTLRRAV